MEEIYGILGLALDERPNGWLSWLYFGISVLFSWVQGLIRFRSVPGAYRNLRSLTQRYLAVDRREVICPQQQEQ